MELSEYLSVLRKRWLVIVLLAVLGAGAGYATAKTSAPTYRSTATVFVTVARADTVSEAVQGATYTQNLVQSYVQLTDLPVVLDPVIAELGLTSSARELAGRVQADSPLGTMMIDIAAVGTDPQQAADIANSVSRHLANTVRELAPTSSDGRASLEMTTVAEAHPALAPFAPRPRLMGAAGGAAGLALGVVLAIALALLDTRVRTTRDLPTSPARATLGQIPFDSVLSKHPRAFLDDPHSPLAESYRRLRTNLQFLEASRQLRSVVVTSSLPGEGKSTTAVNLALVMAEKGAKVLLVDADLRSPSVASICGLEGGAGLSAVLINEADIEDVAQPWGVSGLHVIAAGQVPPNPSQLIDSEAMVTFLRTVGEMYDFVVIDTAPLLAVTDAAVLARRTDGALVVARSRKVRRQDLSEALAALDAAGAVCLGLLLNGVPSAHGDLRYGYGYGQPAARRRHPFHRLTHRLQSPPPAWVPPTLPPLGRGADSPPAADDVAEEPGGDEVSRTVTADQPEVADDAAQVSGAKKAPWLAKAKAGSARQR